MNKWQYLIIFRNVTRGIKILPPDINISNHSFYSDEGIRYHITAITNVGKSAIKAMKR